MPIVQSKYDRCPPTNDKLVDTFLYENRLLVPFPFEEKGKQIGTILIHIRPSGEIVKFLPSPLFNKSKEYWEKRGNPYQIQYVKQKAKVMMPLLVATMHNVDEHTFFGKMYASTIRTLRKFFDKVYDFYPSETDLLRAHAYVDEFWRYRPMLEVKDACCDYHLYDVESVQHKDHNSITWVEIARLYLFRSAKESFNYVFPLLGYRNGVSRSICEAMSFLPENQVGVLNFFRLYRFGRNADNFTHIIFKLIESEEEVVQKTGMQLCTYLWGSQHRAKACELLFAHFTDPESNQERIAFIFDCLVNGRLLQHEDPDFILTIYENDALPKFIRKYALRILTDHRITFKPTKEFIQRLHRIGEELLLQNDEEQGLEAVKCLQKSENKDVHQFLLLGLSASEEELAKACFFALCRQKNIEFTKAIILFLRHAPYMKDYKLRDAAKANFEAFTELEMFSYFSGLTDLDLSNSLMNEFFRIQKEMY